MDLYTVLDVARTASADQVRAAFRRRAKQTHPDAYVPANCCSVGFIQVKSAYDVLGDPEARQRYDLSLQIDELRETLKALEAQHRVEPPAWEPGQSTEDWDGSDAPTLVKRRPKTLPTCPTDGAAPPRSATPRPTAKLWPLLRQLCGVRQRRRTPRREI